MQVRFPLLTLKGSQMKVVKRFDAAAGAHMLAKRLAEGEMVVTAQGYEERSFTLADEQALGLHFTLYKPGRTPPASVTVNEAEETQQLHYPTGYNESYELYWADTSRVVSYCTPSAHTDKDVTYQLIHLDNELFRLSVSPQTASRVLYAEDKSRQSSRQLFATPGSNYLMKGNMFGNLGGLKPSFPYAENSNGLVDTQGALAYAAGYFIQRHPDGAASVIMNQRFDYNQLEQDCSFFGRYGDRSLVTVVTLYPGHTDFSIEYIVDNPNPLRRSDRFWNNAILPFSPTSWIFPAKRAIQHCAREDVWDMEALGWGLVKQNHISRSTRNTAFAAPGMKGRTQRICA